MQGECTKMQYVSNMQCSHSCPFIPVTVSLIFMLYLHNTCLKIKAFMIGRLST